MSTGPEESSRNRDGSDTGESGAQVAPDHHDRPDPADAGWNAGQVVKDQLPPDAVEHEGHERGWRGSEVVHDQDREPADAASGWRGSEVVHDQDTEPADTGSGWSGSQVVHDQDQEPPDEETGWDASQIVTDLGNDTRP